MTRHALAKSPWTGDADKLLFGVDEFVQLSYHQRFVDVDFAVHSFFQQCAVWIKIYAHSRNVLLLSCKGNHFLNFRKK
jgi:hypothetical protein